MNPFRIDNKPGADTRRVVRSVLAFMAQSFEQMERENDVPFNHAMEGAAHIVKACADALRKADTPPERGGDDQ